jgi:hypothetical protein
MATGGWADRFLRSRAETIRPWRRRLQSIEARGI